MRPIDADALIADIRATFEGMEGTMASSGALYAIVSLKSAPTLTLDDLRPKGRWVDGNCSMCGASIPTDNQWDFIDESDCHYCYNCGADMRGGGEDG